MNKIKIIAVIGLGYVGLPFCSSFSTKYLTVGFDMNQRRVDTLMSGHDVTLEVADDLLQDAIHNHGFKCTTRIDEISDCNFYIVAVPTPVMRITVLILNLCGVQVKLLEKLFQKEI